MQRHVASSVSDAWQAAERDPMAFLTPSRKFFQHLLHGRIWRCCRFQRTQFIMRPDSHECDPGREALKSHMPECQMVADNFELRSHVTQMCRHLVPRRAKRSQGLEAVQISGTAAKAPALRRLRWPAHEAQFPGEMYLDRCLESCLRILRFRTKRLSARRQHRGDAPLTSGTFGM